MPGLGDSSNLLRTQLLQIQFSAIQSCAKPDHKSQAEEASSFSKELSREGVTLAGTCWSLESYTSQNIDNIL